MPNFKYGQHKYWTKALLIGIGLIALGGCANMSPTGQRALNGGAIGAAGGAVLGAGCFDALKAPFNDLEHAPFQQQMGRVFA